jgi:hypothetical protein
MRFVILHYHFLKNAGMTVEDMLRRSFGTNCMSIDTPDRDAEFTTDALVSLLIEKPALKAISSHQFRYPVPQIRGYMFFDLCFLRDPIDRVRSTYDYFREKPGAGDPISELASRTTLGEFIACLVREMPWWVNDTQVNLLANGIANDAPTFQDFERAVDRMLQVSFLGVVDRFQESLVAGEHFLQPVFPELAGRAEAANATAGLEATLEQRRAGVRDACDPEIYADLLELNVLDSRLLEMAREEVERRFKSARLVGRVP